VSTAEDLMPCINVFNDDHYKKVLVRVVEVYRDRREGASFYHLYRRERVLKSANMLMKVLETLVSCGYTIYVERSAETNSPKKRKDYIPTPLGAFVYYLIKLEDIIENLYSMYADKFKLIEEGEEMSNEEVLRKIKMYVEELYIELKFAIISQHIGNFIDVGLHHAIIATLHVLSQLHTLTNFITGINAILLTYTAPHLRKVKEIEVMELIKYLRSPVIGEVLLKTYAEKLSGALRELQFALGYFHSSYIKKCKEGVGEALECKGLKLLLKLLEHLKEAYLLIVELSDHLKNYTKCVKAIRTSSTLINY
jgi:hypothetical protein